MILERPTLNTTKTFCSNWWQNTFLKDTQNFNKTCVFKNCINPTDINDLRIEVSNTINTICELKTEEYGFRVWLDGEQTSLEKNQYVFENQIENNESIEDWSNRVFKNKKFGIILNAAEVLNPKLAQKIASFMIPLFKTNGTPLRGYNITLFIGNYGFTPLGIHKDPPGESVIHFHLGPSKKTIYQWDNDKLDQEISEKNLSLKKNVKELLSSAIPYTFNEGDLYFMPSKNYHIGETDELSIGIALWSNKNFKEELSKELLQCIQEKCISDSKNNSLNKFNTLESVSDMSLLFDLPENQDKLTFKDLCQESYKNYRYSLMSNCSFLKTPMLRGRKKTSFNENDYFINEAPFKIEFYSSGLNKEKLIVFIRGHKIVLKNNIQFIQILDYINMRETIKVQTILNFINSEVTKEQIMSLLSTLEYYYGIKKNNPLCCLNEK